jgi:hypothetical protein
MTEAQRMLRQEHWFHNGNGSAHQRYYYGQNEMLAKYGGLASLPRDFEEHLRSDQSQAHQRRLPINFTLSTSRLQLSPAAAKERRE